MKIAVGMKSANKEDILWLYKLTLASGVSLTNILNITPKTLVAFLTKQTTKTKHQYQFILRNIFCPLSFKKKKMNDTIRYATEIWAEWEAVGAAVVKVAGRPHSENTCSPSY